MIGLSEILIKSMDLWCKIREFEFDSTKATNLAELTSMISYSDIKKDLELDKTGFLSILRLKMDLEYYLDETRVKMIDIVDNESIVERIRNIKELRNILSEGLIKDILSEEIITLQKAISNISGKVSIGEVENTMSMKQITMYSYNYRKALLKLNSHLFRRGNTTCDIPLISKVIYRTNSIHSFVSTLANDKHKSLIATCLIEDISNPLFSFFAVGIKNNERIHIIEDTENSPHPMYKYYTRRAGRHQEERMCEYYFPYYLMDIDTDGRGDLMIRSGEYSEELQILGTVDELGRGHKEWLVGLYNCIIRKYFIENDVEDMELSYTSDMINVGSDSKEIVLYNLEKLEIEIPNKENIQKNIEKGLFRNSLDANKSIYENIVVKIPNVDLVKIGDFEIELRGKKVNCRGLDKNTFGTKEKIESDLIYMARYNEANIIKEIMEEEYTTKKEEIKIWYYNHLNNNIERIYNLIKEGTLVSEETYNSFNEIRTQAVENLKIVDIRDYPYFTYWNVVVGDYEKCIVNGKKPSLKACFRVTHIDTILKITGLDISEIPAEIREYTKGGKYTGNKILDRIDPIESIHNKYNDLIFDIEVPLSKSGLKKIQKGEY